LAEIILDISDIKDVGRRYNFSSVAFNFVIFLKTFRNFNIDFINRFQKKGGCMSKLRRLKIFSFVLPVLTVIFLFSVIGTATADSVTGVYIGRIDARYPETGDRDEMLLRLFNDFELTDYVGTYYVRAHEAGTDFPESLGLVALSAQTQRTRVNIWFDGVDNIYMITQDEDPDDVETHLNAQDEVLADIWDAVDPRPNPNPGIRDSD